MKKIVEKETHYCDNCGKEADYPTICFNCKTELCYDCGQKLAKEYKTLMHFRGSGDLPVCKKCESELIKSGQNNKFNAFYKLYLHELKYSAVLKQLEKETKDIENKISKYADRE